MKARILALMLLAMACSLPGGAQVAFDKADRDPQQAVEQLQQRAACEDKLVLLYFTSVYCPPCRELEREFFPDAAVGEKLNARFVSAKLDGDKAERKGLYRRFGLDPGFPAFVVLTADGKVLGRMTGAPVRMTSRGPAIDKERVLTTLVGFANGKAAR